MLSIKMLFHGIWKTAAPKKHAAIKKHPKISTNRCAGIPLRFWCFSLPPPAVSASLISLPWSCAISSSKISRSICNFSIRCCRSSVSCFTCAAACFRFLWICANARLSWSVPSPVPAAFAMQFCTNSASSFPGAAPACGIQYVFSYISLFSPPKSICRSPYSSDKSSPSWRLISVVCFSLW